MNTRLWVPLVIVLWVAVSICHVSRWSRGACDSKLDNSSICLSYAQELMGMSYHVSTHIVYLRKRGGGSDGHAAPKVPKRRMALS